MYTYYISVGSNMGKREEFIKAACASLQNHPLVTSVLSSSLIETAPWGYEEQDAFINGLWKCRSSIKPLDMLDILQGLEGVANRERLIHWGPRTLDLDIIYLLDEHQQPMCIDMERLQVPHPYFWDRLFVLEPLKELEPGFIYNGVTIDQRIQELTSI